MTGRTDRAQYSKVQSYESKGVASGQHSGAKQKIHHAQHAAPRVGAASAIHRGGRLNLADLVRGGAKG